MVEGGQCGPRGAEAGGDGSQGVPGHDPVGGTGDGRGQARAGRGDGAGWQGRRRSGATSCDRRDRARGRHAGGGGGNGEGAQGLLPEALLSCLQVRQPALARGVLRCLAEQERGEEHDRRQGPAGDVGQHEPRQRPRLRRTSRCNRDGGREVSAGVRQLEALPARILSAARTEQGRELPLGEDPANVVEQQQVGGPGGHDQQQDPPGGGGAGEEGGQKSTGGEGGQHRDHPPATDHGVRPPVARPPDARPVDGGHRFRSRNPLHHAEPYGLRLPDGDLLRYHDPDLLPEPRPRRIGRWDSALGVRWKSKPYLVHYRGVNRTTGLLPPASPPSWPRRARHWGIGWCAPLRRWPVGKRRCTVPPASGMAEKGMAARRPPAPAGIRQIHTHPLMAARKAPGPHPFMAARDRRQPRLHGH